MEALIIMMALGVLGIGPTNTPAACGKAPNGQPVICQPTPVCRGAFIVGKDGSLTEVGVCTPTPQPTPTKGFTVAAGSGFAGYLNTVRPTATPQPTLAPIYDCLKKGESTELFRLDCPDCPPIYFDCKNCACGPIGAVK